MMHLLLALHLATYNLSAEQADYDGKNLTLSGHFQITHPMGRLSATHATLQNLQLRGPAKKPAQLSLENNVRIEVPEGKAPFTLTANKAFCQLLPSPILTCFQFQEIHFFDQVEIQTLHSLIARGGSAVYKQNMLTLFPHLPTTHCQLIRGEERIDASEIRFDLLQETLLLIGNVQLLSSRIKNKRSFATADSLLYHPQKKSLIFSCAPPKKVLFWQEGLSLSASEVRVFQDPASETETIEGLGDVHFSFDGEEKNTIEKLISNYL